MRKQLERMVVEARTVAQKGAREALEALTVEKSKRGAHVTDPEMIVIDSRTPDWFAGGTIPGAVNIPYTQIIDELGALGCEPDFDGWDCTQARKVALFCNGLWCGQSPTAIRNMIEAGYPAERIFYYRGGMQSWRVLGLTVTGE